MSARHRTLLAACFLLGTLTAQAAQDPLASPTSDDAALGTPRPVAKRSVAPRRRARHPARARVGDGAAGLVPNGARPALDGVDVLAPVVRDYPRLAPEPRDDAAALTPAFYLGGLARFVTQPPPPVECRPQRRADIGRPGYVPGAPLYCAQMDP